MYGMSCAQLVILNQTAHVSWSRFHQIPSFGKGSIRRFPTSVSGARQCAARYFEDVLQVSIVYGDYLSLGLTFDSVCYACIRGAFSF